MTRADFLSALRRFAEDSNIELVPGGEDFFELRLSSELREETERRIYLQAFPGTNRDTVTEINFSCLCGEIISTDEPAVLQSILERNRGGVMGTEFYFSSKDFNGHKALFLETRQFIEPDYDEDDVIAVMTTLSMNPLFIREWDFPTGVQNFL